MENEKRKKEYECGNRPVVSLSVGYGVSIMGTE